MNDRQQDLRDQLQQLDAELQRTSAADERSRAHLQAMQRDLQALLAQPEPVTPASAEAGLNSLTAGLRHFEVTHPVLTSLIDQVLTTLSNLGI
jgi:hypothetical protein